MINLPVLLYDTQAIRLLENNAINMLSITAEVLMKRAAAAGLMWLRESWPDARRIVVICGNGNNAGDGLVLAQLALEEGLQVEVFTIEPTPAFQDVAKNAFEAAVHRGVSIKTWSEKIDLSNADVLIDAIFGIGVNKEVGGIWKQVIETINANTIPVMSLDIPSGLCANTGDILGCAVNADITVSFVGLKQGLFTHEGLERRGKLYFDSLDIPQEVYETVTPTASLASFADTYLFFQPRPRSSHKGNFGHVLVIGGEEGFSGAVRMSAEAAARVGAGLVSVATRSEHAKMISAVRPELMVHGIMIPEELAALLAKATVIAIGPGLQAGSWGKSLWSLMSGITQSLVVDADALNMLALNPYFSDQWVLTPHPGEAARLLKVSVAEIQHDRIAAAINLQKQYGGTIVLKGAGTIVVGKDHFPWICDAGNAGMATGGMGDVLTGIIAGLIAQGVSLEEAARMGVFVHAKAADYAAQWGERGILAMDLMPYLRELVNPGGKNSNERTLFSR